MAPGDAHKPVLTLKRKKEKPEAWLGPRNWFAVRRGWDPPSMPTHATLPTLPREHDG